MPSEHGGHVVAFSLVNCLRPKLHFCHSESALEKMDAAIFVPCNGEKKGPFINISTSFAIYFILSSGYKGTRMICLIVITPFSNLF